MTTTIWQQQICLAVVISPAGGRLASDRYVWCPYNGLLHPQLFTCNIYWPGVSFQDWSAFFRRYNIIIIIILFISYIIVQQQDVVSKKTPKVQNMVWPTIQLHGRQIHDYVVSITLVHSMTGHSVVTYHNTLRNNASIMMYEEAHYRLTVFVSCWKRVRQMWYVWFPELLHPGICYTRTSNQRYVFIWDISLLINICVYCDLTILL